MKVLDKKEKRRKNKGIILSKKSKHDKGYRYVKAKDSSLFKLIYTFSWLEFEQFPMPSFELTKSNDYRFKHMKNCVIRLENFKVDTFEGVVMKIYDEHKKEIITSKCIKVDFDWKRKGEHGNSIRYSRSIEYFFPDIYYYNEYIHITSFSCEFKHNDFIHTNGEKNNFVFEFGTIGDSGIHRGTPKSISFGVNMFSKVLTKKNSKKNNYREAFKNMYEEIWDEKLTLKSSPYLKIFNNLKTKKHEYV